MLFLTFTALICSASAMFTGPPGGSASGPLLNLSPNEIQELRDHGLLVYQHNGVTRVFANGHELPTQEAIDAYFDDRQTPFRAWSRQARLGTNRHRRPRPNNVVELGTPVPVCMGTDRSDAPVGTLAEPEELSPRGDLGLGCETVACDVGMTLVPAVPTNQAAVAEASRSRRPEASRNAGTRNSEAQMTSRMRVLQQRAAELAAQATEAPMPQQTPEAAAQSLATLREMQDARRREFERRSQAIAKPTPLVDRQRAIFVLIAVFLVLFPIIRLNL